MSVRGIIVAEVHRRIVDAAWEAKVLVAREAEDEPVDGGELVTVIPQTEQYWADSEMNDPRSARQMTLIVAVGYQPKIEDKPLVAWEALETLAEKVVDALLERVLEDPDGDPDTESAAAYLKVFELDGMIASEQPVGGASIGLDISFDVKYCR